MSLRAHDASTGSLGTSESASVIDRHSEFDGTYSTDRDLRIEGRASGKLSCQGTLHVAQGATVNAEIEAEQVVVAGVLEGTVNCRARLQIMPSGELKGRISTPSLVISEGARYEGQMEMPTQKPRLAARNYPPLPGASLDSPEAALPEPGTARSSPSTGFIRRLGQQEPREQPEASPGENHPEAASES
ncbi:MAG: polymer-forming cytoskeletal protein [Chloroflexota bacterium]|nr:polymer-forming cytoskeletal protein [Chloroflexota bacterium]